MPDKSLPGALNLRTLVPGLAAEIVETDASRGIDKAMAAAIARALDACGVIVVRALQLTPLSFVALCRNFGALQTHTRDLYAPPDQPELMVYSTLSENGETIGRPEAERSWHMDGAHLKTPHRMTLQYAVEVPVREGNALDDTCFASTRAAYDTLEPALRQQLHGMRAVHVHGIAKRKRSTPYFADAGMSQIFRRGVEHPVVRTHPRSGHKCLYVNPSSTSHIQGLNDRDSRALLARLYAHIEHPAHVYRHPWQAGDLVLWDNCAIQHRSVMQQEPPARRLLYRVQVKGAGER